MGPAEKHLEGMIKMSRKYYTIEPEPDGTYRVFEHGTYPRNSVLAGRPRRTGVDFFATLSLARAAFPKADLLDHSSRIEEYFNQDSWGDD